MNMPDNRPAAESRDFNFNDNDDADMMTMGGEQVELVGLEADVWAQAEASRGAAYVSPEEIERREDTRDPAERMIRQAADWLVYTMVDDLPIRTQIVLQERAGLEDDPKTLEEVGEEFGITRERIRQIEKKALNKFKNDGSLQMLAYLTGRSEEEPLPEPEAERREPDRFILEPNYVYADAIAAWRAELWERQQRGEHVHVRGRLLRQSPFPAWLYEQD